jgi:predicted nucleic acid-binding protein
MQSLTNGKPMNVITSGNQGIINAFNNAIANLREVLEESGELMLASSVEVINHTIANLQRSVSNLTGEGYVANDRIEDLLDAYEMANLTLDDIKNMAARYSYSYPDSQIRAILHVIGHSNTIVTVPQGWMVVPVRLNQVMRAAAVEASDADDGMGDFFDSVYEATLAASPNLGQLVDTRSAAKMALAVGGTPTYDASAGGTYGMRQSPPIESISFTREQLDFFVAAVVGLDRVS